MIPELPGDDRKPGPRPPLARLPAHSLAPLQIAVSHFCSKANQSKTSHCDAAAWNDAGEKRRRLGQVITSAVRMITDDNDDSINNDNTFSQIQKR